MNRTVTDKHGKTISLCSFSYTDSEGRIESCRAHAACSVCGQCSRLDGDRELGHCTGHMGLNEHITGIPGREQNKAREEINKKQAQINEQQRLRQGIKAPVARRKRTAKQPIVQHKAQLRK